MTIDTLIIALALAFIIEGFFPACFPNKWQAYVEKLAKEPTTNVRNMGFLIMAFGILLLWLFTS